MFQRRISIVLTGLLALAISRCVEAASDVPLEPFLNEHCLACHSGDGAEADLDLKSLAWDLTHQQSFDRWTSVLDRVAAGEMPPSSETQPQPGERVEFVKRLKTSLVDVNRRMQREEGRTTIRRLNRSEYEHTIQDLLAITTPLQHLLPDETPLYGFDTVSDGLRFSALHIDKLLAAADVALDEAIRLHKRPDPINQRFPYLEQSGIVKNLQEKKSIVRPLDDAVVLFADASYMVKLNGVHVAEPGLYRLRARGWAFQSDRPVVLRLNIGNYQSGSVRTAGFFDMLPNEPTEVEVIARVEPNEYFFPSPDDLQFDTKGQTVWNHDGNTYSGNGLALQWIEVEGPLVSTWPPESVRRVFGDTPIVEMKQPRWANGKRIAYEVTPTQPKRELEKVIRGFAKRAFRRPLVDGEVDRYIALGVAELDASRTFDQATRVALRAILTSPQFLIHSETPGRLDQFSLASRLSYFLTHSTPDERLLRLASEGKLSEPATLRSETERLLDDPRSDRFVESFVDQWLDLRRIDATSPDAKLYPEFDQLLRLSMVDETHAFFRELIDRNLSTANLIDSEFAMLNRRLAEHYGIEGVEGQNVRRVTLPSDSPRGGVLTQASVLKVTANGTVTSPVTRGSFVLTRLLNSPPPPPPPGVGSIEPDTRGATTVREQLAKHRSDTACASCHSTIDPPGFALESFDVIGGWRAAYRSADQGQPVKETFRGRKIWEYKHGPVVDSSGQWHDGTKFDDVIQFKQQLLGQRDKVARSIVSNLIVYATGQRIELADRDVVQQIIDRTAKDDHGVRSIIHEIVASELFQSK